MTKLNLKFSALASVLILLGSFNSVAQEMKDIDINGFVSQGFIYTTDNNYLDNQSEDGSFEFNEIAINFNSQVREDLRLGIQFLSRDIGDLYNNQVQVDWALADYQLNEMFGIEAGIIKRPLGLFNEYRDIDSIRSSVLLPQAVYSENFRDSLIRIQGAGIYGVFDIAQAGFLGYRLLAGSSNIEADGGEARRIENSVPMSVDDFDFDKVYVASLEWLTPIEGLRVVGTAGLSELSVEGTGSTAAGELAGAPFLYDFKKYDIYTGSVEYNSGNTLLAFEYLRRELDAELSGAGQVLPSLPGLTTEGYYVSASYRFSELFELGAYWSQFIFDTRERGSSATDDYAISTRFDINENWIVKLEGHYLDGTSVLNQAQNPDGFDDSWMMFLTKATYTF